MQSKMKVSKEKSKNKSTVTKSKTFESKKHNDLFINRVIRKESLNNGIKKKQPHEYSFHEWMFGNHSGIENPFYDGPIHERPIGDAPLRKIQSSDSIQAKLKMGKPGDRYEQEADRIAERVMSMPDADCRLQPT